MAHSRQALGRDGLRQQRMGSARRADHFLVRQIHPLRLGIANAGHADIQVHPPLPHGSRIGVALRQKLQAGLRHILRESLRQGRATHDSNAYGCAHHKPGTHARQALRVPW